MGNTNKRPATPQSSVPSTPDYHSFTFIPSLPPSLRLLQQFDTDKADGQYKKTASNAKLRSLRPDYCFTTIEEGLAKTCAWFKENYATARK